MARLHININKSIDQCCEFENNRQNFIVNTNNALILPLLSC